MDQEQTQDQQAQEQDNASAIESMTAGYNKQRGITPDDEPPPPSQEEVTSEPEAPVAEEPAVPTVDETIAELKQRIADLAETPQSVRKIYGELGNIQRTIKELKQHPQTAAGTPSADVLEALKQAESVAEEFPELAGPLVKVLKAMSTHTPAVPASSPSIDIEATIAERVTAIKQQEAIEELQEEHPDYVTVRDTAEYKEWLAGKDAAFQEKFLNTWNPRVVSKGLTEFKAWRDKAQAAQEKKQSRLEAAITPKGDGGDGQPSKLPDSAGLAAGYNKVRRLQRTA